MKHLTKRIQEGNKGLSHKGYVTRGKLQISSLKNNKSGHETGGNNIARRKRKKT